MGESVEGLDRILRDFCEAVRRFCRAAESVVDLPLEDYLRGLEITLADLYCKGAQLPAVEPESQDLNRRYTEENSAKLRAALQGQPSLDLRDKERLRLLDQMEDRLGELDNFWQVPDPANPGQAEDDYLSRCIHDIYRDIRWAIDAADREEPPASILEIAQGNFEWHWGRHVVDALRALHFLIHVRLPNIGREKEPPVTED